LASSIGQDPSWISRNDFVARYLLVFPDDDLLVGRQLIGITGQMNLPNQEVDAWALWIFAATAVITAKNMASRRMGLTRFILNLSV